MTIVFETNSLLPIEAISTMGVSVKLSSSPIGFFGTGLKFAIATLLRTGHRIELWIGLTKHTLSAHPASIRGEAFDIVHLDGKPLGFTTQLGKNWEPIHAYRELASNTMDEAGGRIYPVGPGTGPDQPSADRTILLVSGSGIEDAYQRRAEIFTEAPILFSLPGSFELRSGQSSSIFYRGIAVAKLPKPSFFTWNILETVKLTEDRTMEGTWSLPWLLGKYISQLPSEEWILSALLAKEEFFEHSLNYSWAETIPLSPAFTEVMARLVTVKRGPPSLHELYYRLHPKVERHTRFELSEAEKDQFFSALRLVSALEPSFAHFSGEIHFVEELGPGVLGQTSPTWNILISREAFSLGTDILAGTLLEEFLHLKKGFADETREFQNYLINQLIHLGHRLLRAPGAAAAAAPAEPVPAFVPFEVPDA